MPTFFATKGFYFSPRELGLEAAVVPAAGNVDGAIIPWRAEHNFQTFTLTGWTSSPQSGQVRASWIDWDGVTVKWANVSLYTGNFSMDNFHYWIKDNSPRSMTGTPNSNIHPMIFGAPYIRFNVSSLSTQFSISLEVMLSDGVKHA